MILFRTDDVTRLLLARLHSGSTQRNLAGTLQVGTVLADWCRNALL